jgi:hypothetical protein
MYVCLECWQVFDYRIVPGLGEGGCCPVKGCFGEIIDLDENFIPVIRLLNEKGYETRFCCSGHVWDDVPETIHAYIAFQDYVKKEELEPLPKGWKFNEPEEGPIIRAEYRASDPVRIQLAILDGVKAVAKWALGLKIKDLELLASELEQGETQ